MESILRKELMSLLVKEEELKREFFAIIKETPKDNSLANKLQETFRIVRKGVFLLQVIGYQVRCKSFWNSNLSLFEYAALVIGDELVTIHRPSNEALKDFDNEKIEIGFRANALKITKSSTPS